MSIPYTLRTHKYVDRALLIELLHRFNVWRNKIATYSYIGFGGPFLDDFRLLHHAFGFHKMISIEERKETYDRQHFNLPSSSVDLVLGTMAEFLDRHDFENEVVLWLDYESPKQYESQFDEAQVALAKMDEGDIFRITFNIDPKSLKADGPRFARATEEEKAIRRKTILDGKLGKYKPRRELNLEIFEHPCDISQILIEVLQGCAEQARRGKRAKFHHLMSTKYCDTVPMLTITGVVARDIDEIKSTPSLRDWPFVSFDEFRVVDIHLPVLSASERLLLEKHLPAPDFAELEKVGPKLSRSEYEGLLLFYRFLPHFQRIPILT